MEPIRLHIQLDDVELGFEGSRGLYERTIEPLMEAACRSVPQAPSLELEVQADPNLVSTGAESTDAPTGEDVTVEAEIEREEGPEKFVPEAPDRFRQFVAQVGGRASTDEQRIMAFGFYLWNYEKRNAFGAPDVASFLATLHLNAPDDLPGVLASLRDRKRFLESTSEESGTEPMYGLSTKGVNYVKNRLLGTV